jgi:hypothetical protein
MGAVAVIASEAKQSSAEVTRKTGLLRRFAPRNDVFVFMIKTTTAFARGAGEGRVDRRVALEARELAWELFASRTRCGMLMPLRRAEARVRTAGSRP